MFRRFLTLAVLCILLFALVPALSSFFTPGDGVFDDRQVLQVDAASLSTTFVSPHLQTPIKEGCNVLWCGTFQLAWNEACALVGEDLHFAGKEPEMVAKLNQKSFLRNDLDDASFVALADFVGNDVRGRIDRELSRKFGPGTSARCLPSHLKTPRPQDIIAYSYLLKNLEFAHVFERIEVRIVSAVQNTRFQMDEKGVKLRSESSMGIGCAARHRPPQTHSMIFDRPFLILLQRCGVKTPYFAMWIANAELLQRLPGT